MNRTVMDIVSYVHSGPMQDVYDLIARVGATDAAAELIAEASAEGVDLVDADDMEAYLTRLAEREGLGDGDMDRIYALISGEGDTGTIEIVTTTARGIMSRLEHERCGGDRWAWAVEMMDGETPETAIERGRFDKSCRV